MDNEVHFSVLLHFFESTPERATAPQPVFKTNNFAVISIELRANLMCFQLNPNFRLNREFS